jgi:hypothetical protein
MENQDLTFHFGRSSSEEVFNAINNGSEIMV